MKVISIAIGTYSVKILELQKGRQQWIPLKFTEIPLKNINGTENSPYALIKEHLDEDSSAKIVMNAPYSLLGHRFLTFPVVKMKLASLMLPHQLEGDIPFSLGQVHHASLFLKQKRSIYALSAYSPLEKFEPYYKELQFHHIVPDLLTTEMAGIQLTAMENNKYEDCCYLDIGHRSTKAYFIHHKKITSFHTYPFGGEKLTEVIARNYDLGPDEAEQYKKEKAFCLTQEQFTEAKEDQKEFAMLMQRSFTPLLQEFQKWELGHRIHHGHKIEHLFLLGGVSQLKNLGAMLQEALAVTPSFVFPLTDQQVEVLAIDQNQRPALSSAYLLGQCLDRKVPSLNFLHSKFSGEIKAHIPLHSMSFVGARALIVAAALLVFFLGENLYLSSQIKTLDKKILRLLKNPHLEMTRRQQRLFKKKPQLVINKLKKIKRQNKIPLETLKNWKPELPLTTLNKVSSPLKPYPEIMLDFYKWEKGKSIELGISSTEKTAKSAQLEKVKKALTNLNLKNSIWNPGDKKQILTFDH